MDQKIIDLYQKYTQKKVDRRTFLKKTIALAGSAAAVAALLPLLESKYGYAQVVSRSDPRIKTGYIKYPAGQVKMKAYSAKPVKGDKFPAVIVIHENKGLRPQTEDVARRFALEGFWAIAPDALTPLGGAPADANLGRDMMRKLDKKSTFENFAAAVAYLKTNPQTNGRVGCTGFCWGGGMTNQLAVNSPDLAAAVPFYGRQPKPEDVARIKAAMLCHYGGLDKRINEGIPDFEKALKAAGIDYKIYIYEGAGHAFFNDTRAERYHKKAADLAWKRTVSFFKDKLNS